MFGHGYRRYYIKGVAGDSYAGDIAIDDISFRMCDLNKLCSDDKFTCDVAQCIDADKVRRITQNSRRSNPVGVS